MKRFYLTGQRTFGNRGCEAIVRSTVGLLRERFPRVEVLVPSSDIARDSAQWPDAADHGVRFVEAYSPRHAAYWVNLQRLPLPALKRAGWPFPMPSWLKRQMAQADAVLAIGGDNYSLDYRIPSPFMGVDKLAMDMGMPVMLWGASVGPFEREPHFADSIADHLARMRFVAVRESVSRDYLVEQLRLDNVVRMADPAFTLQKQAVDLQAFWPDSDNGVLGINVSSLIERYKGEGQNLRAEVAGFLRRAVRKHGLGVLLVPHVGSLRADDPAGDATYMAALLEQCRDLGSRVRMMPNDLNAAQIKHVIGNLRFFIGARTHATIAALSGGVPTVSIAYSVKARGINRDLFGNEDAVLHTNEVSETTLQQRLDWLLREERPLRDVLAARIPALQQAARDAAAMVAGAIERPRRAVSAA